MKILQSSGEAYDLYPDTDIELIRFNPFFHELGEQSVPVSIPASNRNLQLLGHPDRADSVNKPQSRIDAVIQSGVYSIACRQAILSAQRGGNIETSFYLHEGAFYEKISDVTLSEIFEGKKIEFPDIDTAIAFCANLLTVDDLRFALFEVITDNYLINQLEYRSGAYYLTKRDVTYESIDDATVTIPKGFYISPFIKVRHVLQEVFSHLGYQLGSSFLDNSPFKDMVFLNDNLDTIVGNSINYVDVVPNITVKTLLEIIRKFNVEFIPDEINKVVNISHFDEPISLLPSVDFTPFSGRYPLINFHNNYRQVKLSSDHLSIPGEISRLRYNTNSSSYRWSEKIDSPVDNDLALIEILSQYPTVYIRNYDGAVVRDGVRGASLFVEKVSSLSIPYYAGGNLTAEEYSFPDLIPDIYVSDVVCPYVGKGRALQSKIQLNTSKEGDDEIENSEDSQINPEGLRPILSLYYRKNNRTYGTLNNYDIEGNRIWDHSIMWNGEDGIFENFWRERDALLRNAMLEVQLNLILPEEVKMSLPSTRRVSFAGQNYLLSELHYTINAETEGSCVLFSTKLQEPVSMAKSASDFFRERIYKWNIRRAYSVTGTPGRPLSYRLISEPVAFYPPDPTSGQYATGGRYYERVYFVEYGNYGQDNQFVKIGDCEMTVWLEPALY